jgi:hypothetical protein
VLNRGSAAFLLVVSLTAVVIQTAVMIASQAYLFADGAFYLYVILTTRQPQDLQASRYFADLVTQWPVVLAIHSGLTRIDTLSILLGASLYLPGLASLACCIWIARRQVNYLLFPLLSATAVTANSSFFIVSESHLLIALFWPLLFLLTLHRQWSGWTFALAAVLALPTLRCYESMAFLGPLLAVLSTWRMGVSANLAHRLGFFGLTAYFVAGVGVAAYWIINPREPENYESFVNSLRFYSDGVGHVHFLGLLSCAALALVGWALRRNMPATRTRRALVLLFSGACMLAALAPVALPTLIAPTLHHRARVLNAYLPLLVALLFLLTLARPPQASAWRFGLTIAAILGSAQATWHVVAAREWNHYLSVFRREVRERQGLVPYSESRLSRESEEGHPIAGMNWNWTMPTMSILMTVDGNVRSMVDNPTAGPWQPFVPDDPATLPDLSMYGVRFDEYLMHVSRDSMPPVASGEATSPAKGSVRPED